MNTNNYKKGFTLIELLVVIAIIGMLASTVLVSLGTARSKGRDAKRIADLKNIELAIQLYSDSNSGRVPDTIGGLVPTYIKTEPKDPSTGSSYGYVAYKAVAGSSPKVCLKYHLGAVLENRNQVNDGDADFNSSDTAQVPAAQVCGGTVFNGTDGTSQTPTLNTCGMINVDSGHCYDLTN